MLRAAPERAEQRARNRTGNAIANLASVDPHDRYNLARGAGEERFVRAEQILVPQDLFADGNAFADYDSAGNLLGVEVLGPCEGKVFERISRGQPKAVKRFLRGYDEVMLLSQAEIRTIPYLMAEALIAEAVFPIAATGNFGRLQGLKFLQMVQRKVYWLTHHAQKLIELAEG